MKTFSSYLAEAAWDFDHYRILGQAYGMIDDGKLDKLCAFLDLHQGVIKGFGFGGQAGSQAIFNRIIIEYGIMGKKIKVEQVADMIWIIQFLFGAGVEVANRIPFEQLVQRLNTAAPDDPGVKKIIAWSVARELES